MPVGDLDSDIPGTGARFNDGKPPLELLPLVEAAECWPRGKIGLVRDAVLSLGSVQRGTGNKSVLWYIVDCMYPGQRHRAAVDAARVFGFGAKKYAPWNWAKGMAWSVPVGCIARHLLAMSLGEQDDPESGLPHAAHVVCNVFMLLHYWDRYPDLNDLPWGKLGACFTPAGEAEGLQIDKTWARSSPEVTFAAGCPLPAGED